MKILPGKVSRHRNQIAVLSRDVLKHYRAGGVNFEGIENVLYSIESSMQELHSTSKSLAAQVLPAERPVIPQSTLRPAISESLDRVTATINVAAQQTGLDPEEIESMLH